MIRINPVFLTMAPPLFLMFFVVSGAELDLSVIPQIGIIGIIYVVFRVSRLPLFLKNRSGNFIKRPTAIPIRIENPIS